MQPKKTLSSGWEGCKGKEGGIGGCGDAMVGKQWQQRAVRLSAKMEVREKKEIARY